MDIINLVIFPSCPLDGIRKIDNAFRNESNIAKNNFEIAHINIDEIQINNYKIIPTYNLPNNSTSITALYRGWMLSLEKYETMYFYLQQQHNITLINTPKQYSMLHYFPNAYDFIHEFTPHTIYRPIEEIDDLLILSKYRFNNKPIFIKDYVKSESAYPEATFVSDGGNMTDLKNAINKLVQLRGNEMNKGIVIKERIDIAKTILNEDIEYRIVVTANKHISIFERFDGKFELSPQQTSLFINIIDNVRDILHYLSNFFTIDIVLKSDGTFTVIEVGDGQVSGIPISDQNVESFYNQLCNRQSIIK